MSGRSGYRLLLEALSVFNAIINIHQDDGSLRKLFAVARRRLAGQLIRMCVIDDDAGEIACATVRLDHGSFVIISQRDMDSKLTTVFTAATLEEVVAESKHLLQSPTDTDWNWLETLVEKASTV